MRPPHLIRRLRIIQLDIQILIHALQRAPNAHLVLQLNRNLVVHQRLEETEEEHVAGCAITPLLRMVGAWSCLAM
jgi:hypothetical protein